MNNGNDQASITNRSGALFFIVLNQAFSNLSQLRLFIDEREIFSHERKAGSYPTSCYFVAKSLAELPIQLLATLTFCVIGYLLIGLQQEWDKFGVFCLVVVLDTLVAASYTVLIGSAVPDDKAAAILCPIGLTLFLLFGGFFLQATSVPPYWLWMKAISFFKYAFHALARNEFSGLRLECHFSNTSSVDGRGCIATGDEYLTRAFGTGTESLEADLAALAAMVIVYRFLAFLALSYRYKPVDL